MGRRLLRQRAGRGGFPYRAPTHKRLGAVHYLSMGAVEETRRGTVSELKHDPGRGAPVAVIRWDSGEKNLYLPPEGMFEGDVIEAGSEAAMKIGNIKCLKDIPEGSMIYNLESKPGDGGKFVRASGMSATLLDAKEAMVLMPSGTKHKLNPKCRATIGVVGGGGRTEKPFVKAGNKYYWVRSRGTKWPKARGVAMNAQSHPFGGGSHKSPHKPTTTSRDAPPGRKVGLIAASRTGLRKK